MKPSARGPRVVDITQWYSPTSGGIRTYLHRKAAWAAKERRGHGVVVPGERDGRERMADSDVVAIRGRTPARGWGYRLVLRPRPILAALDDLRPDVVVVHDVLAFPRSVVAWARRRRVGVVMVCHSDLALATAGLPQAVGVPGALVLRTVQRRGLRAGPPVLVASAAMRERIAGLTGSEVIISRLGVDTGPFRTARQDPVLRSRLAPSGQALLLYAGRLSSEKRLDLLPRMLAQVRGPSVLVVAGTGAAEGRLRRVAARHGVAGRLRFVGHIPSRARLASLMATADCFVHPNPDEPFGLAPIEALAAGCRVVVPEGSGTAEVLRGRGVHTVAPHDAGALAGGVERALETPRPVPDLDDLGWDATFSREWELYREVAACA